jgi:hypothetical protein
MSALTTSPALAQTLNEEYILTTPMMDTIISPQFGCSVDIDNGIIAVGSNIDDDEGELGSVYLYDAQTQALLHRLQTTDGAPFDFFGFNVAIQDGIVAVGARYDSSIEERSGAVYLFDASTGLQLHKLYQSDPDRLDYFGSAVAIDDGILAIGAVGDDENGFSSGAVYLFDINTGTQLRKVFPNQDAAGEDIGNVIAIDDGVLAAGAPNRHVQSAGSGAGVVYLFDVATGAQLARLNPSDVDNFDHFGSSVALGDGYLAAGSPGADEHSSSSGSAYLFDVTTRQELFKLSRLSGGFFEHYGYSVAIENGVVAVGAYKDSVQTSEDGSIYLFNASDGASTIHLYESIPSPNTRLASTLAMDGDYIIAGNKRFGNNDFQGAAHVFMLPERCPADFHFDWRLNFLDVSAFLTAYNTQDPSADLTGDGNLNFLDVSAYLKLFSLECL